VAVPLARSGALPGTVTLSVERKLSGAQPSSSAVLALAGGPGQAALPHAEDLAKMIAPALASRDLLLFDQRGTGASDPLSCSAFEEPASSEAAAYSACAADIGPARGDFTTAETVSDIEAVRRAAGYEKLVLYGTSYGTKVALEYAERFPTHVEALVLDSVIPSDGWEPFRVASFQAIPAMLEELCAGGGCAGITTDPTADVARLSAQLRRHALHGSVFDGSGHRHAETLDELGLYRVIVAGDLNPTLRALLPAAVRSALAHDPQPLLRLQLLSEGLTPNLPSGRARAASARAATRSALGAGDGELDLALFATTTCEETPFPWQRGADEHTRLQEAQAALRAVPAASFYPFDAATAFAASPVPACAPWPDASPPPPATTPLPAVPTLLLSGRQDLRTPVAYAEQVAARIPGAQLVTVPFVGHSVLGSDLSHCSEQAVRAFFSSAPVQQCASATNEFTPTPINPPSLQRVHAPRSLPGRRGQTLVAALDALEDLNRQIVGAAIQAGAALPSGSSFGGLRGGYARVTSTAVSLRRFSFVPGVELSGTFRRVGGELATTTLHISGSQAEPGTLRFGSASKRLTGRLGGQSYSIALAGVHISRAGARGWPPLSALSRLLALGPR
jgi:pimeloyl-ACP methyl ester carboxylesterase